MDACHSEMKTDKMSTRKTKLRQNLTRTIFHGLAIFTLGMTVSMRGPSFIDLQLISGADVESGSFYYTASAFGYIVGALFTGALYSRLKSKTLLVIVGMTFSAVIFATTPWCSHFVPMLTVHAMVAFFWALYETTVNTEEVKSWEGNSYSAMQFLSFTYSLGGIIGPLLVEPFLAPKAPDTVATLSTTHNTTSNTSSVSEANVSRDLYHATEDVFSTNISLLELEPARETVVETDNVDPVRPDLNSSNNTHLEHSALQSNIHYGYLIASAIIILGCVPSCVIYVRTKSTLQKQDSEEGQSKDRRGLPRTIYILLTATISMFYLFYTTVDDPFSMYLSVFVVSYLDWSKENGAIVSSLYWGCSTATKLAMIFLVRLINPSVILLASCCGMVLFMAGLTVSAHFRVHFMIWVCTALMALSQSAVFGGGLAWADANLVKCDGRITSSIMVFSSLGAMLDPMLLGVTMKELSPMAFPYLLTFQAFMVLTIFLTMLVGLKPCISRRYGLLQEGHLEQNIHCLDKDMQKTLNGTCPLKEEADVELER